MAERSATFLLSMRFLYLVLCGLVMFIHLLPLEPVTTFWAAPDLMIALTFAWVLRRPEYAPLVF
ncbi:MAG: rod shape-determining protein MreD, partial [Pseudomonadota bacterium]